MQEKNNYFNVKIAGIKMWVIYSCVSSVSQQQQKKIGERRNRKMKREFKNNLSKSAGGPALIESNKLE